MKLQCNIGTTAWGNQCSNVTYLNNPNQPYILYSRGGDGLFDFGSLGNTGASTAIPKSFRTVLVCE